MAQINLTQQEIDFLLLAAKSVVECNSDILQYPNGFSEIELKEIREELAALNTAIEKLTCVTE